MSRAFLFGLLGILFGTARLEAEDLPAGGPEPGRQRPSASEPLAEGLSLARAADYLDGVASEWTRGRNCGSCHTNYPYLIARPSLTEYKSPKELEIRTFFEGRVAHWDDGTEGAKPRWDAEVVATAQAWRCTTPRRPGSCIPSARSRAGCGPSRSRTAAGTG